MTDTILVTGATGNLGRDVVEALKRKGFRVKAASRHPENIPSVENVEPVRMDYDDPSRCRCVEVRPGRQRYDFIDHNR